MAATKFLITAGGVWVPGARERQDRRFGDGSAEHAAGCARTAIVARERFRPTTCGRLWGSRSDQEPFFRKSGTSTSSKSTRRGGWTGAVRATGGTSAELEN